MDSPAPDKVPSPSEREDLNRSGNTQSQQDQLSAASIPRPASTTKHLTSALRKNPSNSARVEAARLLLETADAETLLALTRQALKEKQIDVRRTCATAIPRLAAMIKRSDSRMTWPQRRAFKRLLSSEDPVVLVHTLQAYENLGERAKPLFSTLLSFALKSPKVKTVYWLKQRELSAQSSAESCYSIEDADFEIRSHDQIGPGIHTQAVSALMAIDGHTRRLLKKLLPRLVSHGESRANAASELLRLVHEVSPYAQQKSDLRHRISDLIRARKDSIAEDNYIIGVKTLCSMGSDAIGHVLTLAQESQDTQPIENIIGVLRNAVASDSQALHGLIKNAVTTNDQQQTSNRIVLQVLEGPLSAQAVQIMLGQLGAVTKIQSEALIAGLENNHNQSFVSGQNAPLLMRLIHHRHESVRGFAWRMFASRLTLAEADGEKLTRALPNSLSKEGSTDVRLQIIRVARTYGNRSALGPLENIAYERRGSCEGDFAQEAIDAIQSRLGK